MAIKVLSFNDGGAPKMLSSMDEIEEAIEDGTIVPDTEVTLYLKDDTIRQDTAQLQPELAQYFSQALGPETAAAEEEPQLTHAAVKHLTFYEGQEPRILSSMHDIEEAIQSGFLTAGTEVILFLEDDSRSEGKAMLLPQLTALFSTRSAATEQAEFETGTKQTETKIRRTRSITERTAARSNESSSPLEYLVGIAEKANHLPGVADNKPPEWTQKSTAFDEPQNLFGWMVLPYRRYFEFAGRSRRKEFWGFVLLTFLIIAFFGMIDMADSPLLSLIAFGSLFPGLAVTVRRLHDVGLTGWLALVGLIPYIGWAILIALTLVDGKSGDNDYGPNPKGR